MTVQNLIEKLKQFPLGMEVLLKVEDAEFDTIPLEDMAVVTIIFSEENGEKKEPWSEEKCLLLGECDD